MPPGAPPRRGSPDPHPLAGTAPDAVLLAEDTLRPLLVERAVWFDLGGNEIGTRTGAVSSIVFTPAEATSMKDAIFTHNHPDGWSYPTGDLRRAGNAFSDDDFVLAVRSNMAELRVITPLARFAARRPASGWGISSDRMRQYHEFHKLTVAVEFKSALDAGRMSLEEIEARFYDEIATRLARQLGITYRRWGR